MRWAQAALDRGFDKLNAALGAILVGLWAAFSGVASVILWIAFWLGSLYFLVRFVKWAWE